MISKSLKLRLNTVVKGLEIRLSRSPKKGALNKITESQNLAMGVSDKVQNSLIY